LRSVPAQVRYLTDPACPESWAAEPLVRRLMVEFGDSLSFTWVMGGLTRDYTDEPRPLDHWLAMAGESRMPIDPLLWKEAAIGSSYPACMAVKAAQEQAADGGYRYLRVLREGLMCLRRKLDTTEPLVEAAREAGLNVERFRIDLQSHAIVEAFGEDLEERRAGSFAMPTAVFAGPDGAREAVQSPFGYGELRAAAERAGGVASSDAPPSVADALRRFGRMATREVEEVCRMPEQRALPELWRLAAELEVKPMRVITGWLWEPA
jgi:predicted DsbA family dithiol-disulfide isomerase